MLFLPFRQQTGSDKENRFYQCLSAGDVTKIYGGSTTGRNDEIIKLCDRQMRGNGGGSFLKN
jgi:hypothetical protein